VKLLAYLDHGTALLGVVTPGGVIPTSVAAADFYARGLSALPELKAAAQNATATGIQHESALTLAPVVPNPGKILCVGLNYRKHAAESNMAVPAFPVLFSKFNNAIAAPGEDVPVPSDWAQVDYEAELVVVMGRRARNVSEADALEYVLGYCNGNDLSERALQMRSGQWLLGKTPDKFLPIGPYLVTADEIGDPQTLPIAGWMNGEQRQNSSTADMIFTVAQVIAYASQYMTLMPGDIISTGTPEGVILGHPKDKQVWMKPGDTYTVEVGPLGRLTNQIVAQ
jgi:2-keto-4-pentenoate hydratase/2-oxohepta-3-ene-1,7-dioic acid hydratase in catechol pathway